MITEKTSIKSEAMFSDDRKHRLLLYKKWDNEKPSAMIIMINPNSADNLNCDMTTMLVINNLNNLGYGSVYILNLYTLITNKIHFRFNSDEDLLHPDNNDVIFKSAEKSNIIIIGWGTVGIHNQRIRNRQREVFETLESFSDKIHIISDGATDVGYHPLTPTIRNNWTLEPFDFKEN